MPGTSAVYKPRKPQDSPYYQCVEDHFEEFESRRGSDFIGVVYFTTMVDAGLRWELRVPTRLFRSVKKNLKVI